MPYQRIHRIRKKYDDYGPHDFRPFEEDESAYVECVHGCGCSVNNFKSFGPVGLDPSGGKCPNNPLDGERQVESRDYEDCVDGLIENLRLKLREANIAVGIVERAKKGTKIDLVRKLNEAEIRARASEAELNAIKKELNSLIDLVSDNLSHLVK